MMRIVFAGSPAVAVPTLDALIAAGHDIVAVLSQPDAPAGRGRKLVPSAVSARALELSLPLLRPERAAEATQEIAALQADVGVVVAYGQLLRPPLLAALRHGWINLHFSDLPRWRGAAPVQRAILAGDTETAATVFQLVPALDAGPVWARLETAIGERETAGELLERMSHEGTSVVVEALRRIEAGEQPTEQPVGGTTHAAKLEVADGHLDLSRPAAELDRQVRGVTPSPGAWTTWKGERFKVLRARVDADAPALAPGVLHVTKRAVHVGTGTQPLLLEQVQAFGKRAMAAADWARGIEICDDERMGA